MAITSQNAINGIDGSQSDQIAISEDSYISISTTGSADPVNVFSSLDGNGDPVWDNNSFDSIQSVLDWMDRVDIAIDQGATLFIRMFPGTYACDEIVLENNQLARTSWYVDDSDFSQLPGWSDPGESLSSKVDQLNTRFPVQLVFSNTQSGFVVDVPGFGDYLNIGYWSGFRMHRTPADSGSSVAIRINNNGSYQSQASVFGSFRRIGVSGFVSTMNAASSVLSIQGLFFNTVFGLQASNTDFNPFVVYGIGSSSSFGSALFSIYSSRLSAASVDAWNYFYGNIGDCIMAGDFNFYEEIQRGIFSIYGGTSSDSISINLENYNLQISSSSFPSVDSFSIKNTFSSSDPTLVIDQVSTLYCNSLTVWNPEDNAINVKKFSKLYVDQAYQCSSSDLLTPKRLTASGGSEVILPSGSTGNFTPAINTVGTTGEVIYVP